MSHNVVSIMGKEYLVKPDDVLEQSKGRCEAVLVIGYTEDDKMYINSTANLLQKDTLWLIESYKNMMITGEFDAD